jgi:protein O-GlcNAc transferase
LNNLAIILVSQKRYEETIIYLEDALKADPENVDFLLNMATTLRKAERYGEAIPFYEKVIAKQPDHSGAMYDLGYCYEREKRPKDAVAIYKKYVEVVKNRDPKAAEEVSGLIKRMQGK